MQPVRSGRQAHGHRPAGFSRDGEAEDAMLDSAGFLALLLRPTAQAEEEAGTRVEFAAARW